MLENFRLKVFRVVAEQASFRKASELLHITQPAVSQQIHVLEQELEVSLFDRSGNRVQLTSAGKALLRHARRSAVIAAEAVADLRHFQGKVAGELRLGASTTVAQYILPPLLALFRRQYPSVAVSVMSGNTDWVVESLRNKRIVLGMIEGPVSGPEIHKRHLFEDRMVFIVPAAQSWATESMVSLENLFDKPLLMRERGSGSRRVVENALRRTGIRLSELRIEMELDTTGAIIAGVEAGLGAGFVSLCAVSKEVRLGTIKVVAIEGLEISRRITLIRRSAATSKSADGAFEEFALGEAVAMPSLKA